jgi:mannose-6-phosphate isomerase-like protein (cupin superfamily)
MRTLLTISVLSLVLVPNVSTQQPAPNATDPQKRAVAIPAQAIKWVQVRAGQDTSALWGNRQVGPYGSFNRFAAGFEDRLHSHTRDLHAVVVSGTVVVQNSGAPAQELGPGSYAFVPGGTPHTHSCKTGEPCVLFVQQDGPGDSVSVER